jgi:hypothetical protein
MSIERFPPLLPRFSQDIASIKNTAHVAELRLSQFPSGHFSSKPMVAGGNPAGHSVCITRRVIRPPAIAIGNERTLGRRVNRLSARLDWQAADALALASAVPSAEVTPLALP